MFGGAGAILQSIPEDRRQVEVGLGEVRVERNRRAEGPRGARNSFMPRNATPRKKCARG